MRLSPLLEATIINSYYTDDGGRQTIMPENMSIPCQGVFDTSEVARQRLISVEPATGDRGPRTFAASVRHRTQHPASLGFCQTPIAGADRRAGRPPRLGSLRFGGSRDNGGCSRQQHHQATKRGRSKRASGEQHRLSGLGGAGDLRQLRKGVARKRFVSFCQTWYLDSSVPGTVVVC